MSTCPSCLTFVGAPTCVACRTHYRIGSLLQSGRLSRFSETQVVAALRNCAGALSDLAEGDVAGPFGGGTEAKPKTEAAEEGRWPLEAKEEAPAGEGKEETKASEKAEEEPASSSKKEGKPVKTKRKEKAKDKKKKAESPGKEEPRREVKESRKKEVVGKKRKEKTAEEIRQEKSESLRDSKKRSKEERSEESVVAEESPEIANPRDLHLSTLPVRGSAGRHLEQTGVIPAGAHRPPEPRGPPPDRSREDRHDEAREGRGRSHPREKPPRWRGYSHYNRGVSHWKQVKEDQWRRKQNQRPKEGPYRGRR